MNYKTTIKEIVKNNNPNIIGGCFKATRELIERHPELKEEVLYIKYQNGKITHCVAVTQDDKIIDTQHKQFGLVIEVPNDIQDKFIFTREEHEKCFPRYKLYIEKPETI